MLITDLQTWLIIFLLPHAMEVIIFQTGSIVIQSKFTQTLFFRLETSTLQFKQPWTLILIVHKINQLERLWPKLISRSNKGWMNSFLQENAHKMALLWLKKEASPPKILDYQVIQRIPLVTSNTFGVTLRSSFQPESIWQLLSILEVNSFLFSLKIDNNGEITPMLCHGTLPQLGATSHSENKFSIGSVRQRQQ